MPRRIQLRRTAGWRKPPDAVVVARPTKWGNPWRASEWDGLPPGRAKKFVAWLFEEAMNERLADEAAGVDPYEHEGTDFYPTLDEIRLELAGKDLCCWCQPAAPCHADTLLSVANNDSADQHEPMELYVGETECLMDGECARGEEEEWPCSHVQLTATVCRRCSRMDYETDTWPEEWQVRWPCSQAEGTLPL